MRIGSYVMCILVSASVMSSSPASSLRPQLKSGAGLQIGAALVPWGGHVVLSERDALLRGNGRCAFNFAYEVINTGSSLSGAFKNFLLVRDKIVAIDQSTALAPGAKRQISTQPFLEPGTYALSLQVDAENPDTVHTDSITLTLAGPCANRPEG